MKVSQWCWFVRKQATLKGSLNGNKLKVENCQENCQFKNKTECLVGKELESNWTQDIILEPKTKTCQLT